MSAAQLAPSAATSATPIHRVSLACLPCRTRHLRCNATKPACARCISDGTECTYTRSRRGGRRRIQPVTVTVSASTSSSEQMGVNRSSAEAMTTATTEAETGMMNHSIFPATFGGMDQNLLLTPSSSSTGGSANATQFGLDGQFGLPPEMPTTTAAGSSPSVFECAGFSTELITDYYTYFHPAHCCILPRWSLEKHYLRDPESFTPLLHVIQYIGSFFNTLAPSESYRQLTISALPIHKDELTTLYEVQAMLLFAIATYWSDDVEQGVEMTKMKIIPAALKLRMHLDECAMKFGEGDGVLEESWRRTFWQLYYMYACMAASAHDLPSELSGLEMTVRLPSEDDIYESGDIPRPRTLAEYDMREFLPSDDPGFSSFAHMIGVLRAIDLVLCENVPLEMNRPGICAQIDIGLSAWQSLLPPAKRKLLQDGQGLDRHLFAAHMMINAYTVDFHRSLSDLQYSTIESVARCTPPAPLSKPRPNEISSSSFHTTKALAAIRRVGDLLPLPPNLHTMTPFFVCIIATVTIAHLSACRFLYRDRQLQLERERVRLQMGALRMLGDFWPLGKRTYGEMGVIARENLCLTDGDCEVGQGRLGGLNTERTPEGLDMFLETEIPFFEFQNMA